jgi:hypothetical protein
VNTGAIEVFETTGNQIIYEVENLTTYHVTVTTVDKAGQESAPTEVLEIKTNFTGITLIDKTIFKIYPNPAHNILNIETEISESVYIEIYNLSGNKISHQLMTGANHSINISNFASGIYFIKIGNAVQKFVKY